MGRIASALVLTAVAAIVIVAVIDALRTPGSPERETTPAGPRPIDGLTLLSGTLVWTDAACRLHTTSLPTLQEPDRAHRIPCGARLSTGGRLVDEDPDAIGTTFAARQGSWPPGVGLSLLSQIDALAASPSGRMLAAATRGGVVLVKDGAPRTLPISDATAFAWSPDERWLAAAGEKEVYLVRVLNRDMRIRRLPIAATDVAWVSAAH
jgi:hypothetical protein